jgi:hypothetical protein
MLHPTQTVTTPLTLTVSAMTFDAELAGQLSYDPSDPLAVSLAIGTECDEPVVWVFARDLLAAGVEGAAGEGDITIEPASGPRGRELRITLATDCLATMIVPREPVVDFLASAYTILPIDCEMDRVDFDAEIAALLG